MSLHEADESNNVRQNKELVHERLLVDVLFPDLVVLHELVRQTGHLHADLQRLFDPQLLEHFDVGAEQRPNLFQQFGVLANKITL